MTPNQTITAFPEFADGGTKTKPGDAKYSAGFVEADVLPAEWLNWLLNKPSAAITEIKAGLESIEKELNNLLTAGGETADITDDTQVVDSIKYLRDSITGVLSNLTTTSKTTLVSAINELVSKIGTLTNLITGNKTNLVSAINEVIEGLGTAAGKRAGSAAGNVPINASSLGTTNNNIVVTDATGKLKVSDITVGGAAGRGYTHNLSKNSDALVQSDAVAKHVYYFVNSETMQGGNTTSHTFTLSDTDNVLLTDGTVVKVWFLNDCKNNTSTKPTNTAYFPKLKIGATEYPIVVGKTGTLNTFKYINRYYWWFSGTKLEFVYYNGTFVIDSQAVMAERYFYNNYALNDGYKVYANGHKELWGVFQAETAGWDNYTITLPISMNYEHYSVVASPEIINTTPIGSPNYLEFIIQAKKTDSFVVHYYSVLSEQNPRRICWMIKGS